MCVCVCLGNVLFLLFSFFANTSCQRLLLRLCYRWPAWWAFALLVAWLCYIYYVEIVCFCLHCWNKYTTTTAFNQNQSAPHGHSAFLCKKCCEDCCWLCCCCNLWSMNRQTMRQTIATDTEPTNQNFHSMKFQLVTITTTTTTKTVTYTFTSDQNVVSSEVLAVQIR